MNNDEIKMSKEVARMICEMEVVCDGEGIGGDNDILLDWIVNNYPELAQERCIFHLPMWKNSD